MIMNSFSIKSVTPHVVAVVLFLALTFAYFSPLLEGKKIQESDVMQYYGASKEATDYKEKTGETALWTNSMFGGMPTYLITNVAENNVFIKIQKILTLGGIKPACLVFLYLLGFYIALLAFRVNPWLSIAGAIAYAFSSYFFVILVPGHITKALALGYMPAIIGGVYLAYKRKILLGGIVFGIFLALQLVASHLQITYYTFIIIFILGLFEFGKSIKEKMILPFLKANAVLVLAAVLAIGSNITTLWLTYEYGQYSMRGKSELTTDKENKTSGLDRNYATYWSYGQSETLTLLIPNAKGGASYGKLDTGSETYDYFNKMYGSVQAKEIVKQMPLYWGDQPSTSGPVYAGAAVIFLFVFGMFLLKGYEKWWLLVTIVISILLAWGKNFMGLTNIFFDYVPGYDKFRTVTMILIIAEFSLPLLAILSLDHILKNEIDKKKLIKTLKWSLGIVGGLLLILVLMPGMFFDFVSPNDAQLTKNGWPMDAIQADRESLFRMDAIRSLVFVLLMAGVVYFSAIKKMKASIAIVITGVIFIADLWPIDKRYLNNDSFVTKTEEKTPFTPTQADLDIMKDTDPDYRVLNFVGDAYSDAGTSYFHKSILGYSGAKMKRYQELIMHHIQKNNFQVLNMLNTKYVIVPGKDKLPVAQLNPEALGNAWFVKTYKLVANADSEINALTNFNPAYEAILDKRFENEVKNLNLNYDSTGTIKLTKYTPNALSYESSCNSEQLAVFSEIYYDKGWNAYVDGKLVPHFRVNYVLRAMKVPAGKHKIDFKFEPKTYYKAETISLVSSIVLIFTFIGVVLFGVFRKKKEIKDETVQE